MIVYKFNNDSELQIALKDNKNSIKINWLSDINNLKYPCQLIVNQNWNNKKLDGIDIIDINDYINQNKLNKTLLPKPEALLYKKVRYLNMFDSINNNNILFLTSGEAFIQGCRYNDNGEFIHYSTSAGEIYYNDIVNIIEC
jgi:hypothetical protein